MSALVGALRAMLTLDSTAFVDGAKRARKGQRDLETGFQRLQSTMKKFAAGMALVGGALAIAVRGQLNYADQLGEMAEKIGVPVEELSRLAYAAKITGVPLEVLEKSLEQLSKKMVAAAEGGRSQSQMFADLGVEVTDASGQMRSAEAVLQDVAGAFAEMPDGAAKTTLAMELFGKAGADMILMLNQGKDGLAELSAEADRFGLTVTQETADAAGKFNENLDKLNAAAGGLAMQLAAALAPTLEKISEFAVQVANAFAALSPETKEMLAQMALVLGVVAGATAVFGLLAMALNPVVLAIAAVAAGALLIYENWDGIAQWFSDMWASIRTATEEAWAAVQAAIGGAITYVTGLWDAFVQKLRDALQIAKEVGEAVGEALSTGREEMNSGTGYEGMGGAMDGDPAAMFGGTLIPGSYSTGQAGADGVVEGFKTRIAERMGEITASAEGITQAVRAQWQVASPSRVFREIGQFLTEGLSLGITDNVPMVDAAMGSVGDSIAGGAGSLQSALEGFRSTAESAFVGLVTGALSFRDALSQVLGKLAEMLAQSAFTSLFGGGAGGGGGLLAGLFGFADGAAFEGGRVTAFATGGIVDGATAFGMQGGLGVMGEAVPEAIMPLTRVGGKLGVLAEGGGARVRLEIAEGDMFAARVQTIADERSVEVVKSYDREVVPQSRAKNDRERG